MVAINTIMAESLDVIATELEAALEAGTEFNVAVQKVLEGVITEHGAVVFNGDGYSEEWQVEAAARGLKNLRSTVDALPELDTPETKALFEAYGVLNERELASRYEVYLEQYELSVMVEARSTLETATTMVLPAAVRYQGELAGTAANLVAVGMDPDLSGLESLNDAIASLSSATATLSAALEHGSDSTYDGARHAAEQVLPAMDAVRAAADELEEMVADDLWPLPTYQEMLFIL